MPNSLAPKLVAEFIATFALVFIGAGAAAVVGEGAGLSGIAATAFAPGLIIMWSVKGRPSCVPNSCQPTRLARVGLIS